jgi:hypothetical protein
MIYVFMIIPRLSAEGIWNLLESNAETCNDMRDYAHFQFRIAIQLSQSIDLSLMVDNLCTHRTV